jgi:serine/threonine protein kinase
MARQIATALEVAHDKGIVHRDLKPGNIKITPEGVVKVPDFGLAKVMPTAASGAPSENSPTISMAATQAGMILGTAAYMAPEQARGLNVDKRADIWAFGVVLNERLTGKRLFQGEDLTDTLASVVRDKAGLSAVPSELRGLLERCLEKDPKKRLRDISSVALAAGNRERSASRGSTDLEMAVGCGGCRRGGAGGSRSCAFSRNPARVADSRVPAGAAPGFEFYQSIRWFRGVT